MALLDQRVLPLQEEYVTCRSAEEVAQAIVDMVVRGAPAIGVAAALGIALGARQAEAGTPSAFRSAFEAICDRMRTTRPTAVNLFWAVERMKKRYAALAPEGTAAVKRGLEEEALLMQREDVEINRRMGRHGAELVPDGARILTHCNAGALATAGYGTALGVVRAAVEAGKKVEVFADETRPFLQGARLTAWELEKDNIPVTLITDNMAGHLMSRGRIDLVVLGADRIAANGDVANKIGTYSVAVLAHENEIPFYAVAPTSTFDVTIPDGSHIPIEERGAEEVTHLRGQRIAPEGVRVLNPAFDVTPHRYVTAIVCEKGIARDPFKETLTRWVFEDKA